MNVQENNGSSGGSNARQQMLYDANKKSVGVAYLLWFFLGGFGGHRFYLGQTGTAVAQLALLIIGWATFVAIIGVFFIDRLRHLDSCRCFSDTRYRP
ncbi:TM2 domain-containing protein [Sphingobium yanoikuyae]|jgi:hypothetical protein|uniref:TM2 domain-containing protein n=1 Tax=Sphingobium yanoikuyae TaxID=13690 RepID=UPI001F3F74B7|nr:TM2 domain-containing protein [Sphingobium yanoikuyae]MDG2514463.1 TM2 domain-containing protein [Sphingobium yanoikuyae]